MELVALGSVRARVGRQLGVVVGPNTELDRELRKDVPAMPAAITRAVGSSASSRIVQQLGRG